jgi:manganese efflux pump family protein
LTAFAQLLALGLFLGVDSFRASAGLSAAGLGTPVRLALGFGLCDAAASIGGLAAGDLLPQSLKGALESLGPIVLVGAALYAFVASRRHPTPFDDRWAISGVVPLALSVDNLAGGLALGVFGFPIVVSALVLGAISALLSVAGSAVGRTIGNRLPVRMESAGVALLVLVALSFAVEHL